jgi:hypothetical protein
MLFPLPLVSFLLLLGFPAQVIHCILVGELGCMVTNPGHNFSKILILHDQDLLRELRPLVTTDPTPKVMAMSTGIPPRMELACQMKKILSTVSEIFINLRDQTAQIIEAVKTAIDEKPWDSGHVTFT